MVCESQRRSRWRLERLQVVVVDQKHRDEINPLFHRLSPLSPNLPCCRSKAHLCAIFDTCCCNRLPVVALSPNQILSTDTFCHYGSSSTTLQISFSTSYVVCCGSLLFFNATITFLQVRQRVPSHIGVLNAKRLIRKV